jgi:spermidine synthase
LIWYLIGIALGAYIGKRYCYDNANLWKISGLVLLISSAVDLCTPWIFSSFVKTSGLIFVAILLITLTSLLKAIIFPIAHHLGTINATGKMGYQISRVYVSNIAGATLGPILTGIILLSMLTTQQCYAVFAGLTFILALFCLYKTVRLNRLIPLAGAGCLAVAGVLSLNANLLISRLAVQDMPIRQIVENQHGIIVIYHDAKTNEDNIYGANVYDGSTNLDPVKNTNSINRLMVLSALQDRPKKVLMIGLSIGTWLKLVESFPGIESIDVVEINRGYLTAINNYPQQKSGLQDPRVHLVIDDGRRWLKSHPENKYDLIVMNTTYFWRAYTAGLLSMDFLKILKQHMEPGAVLAYNSTRSPDVFKTATNVFNHAYLYGNFIIAADFDWRNKLIQPAAVAKLESLRLDGKLLYPEDSDDVVRDHLSMKYVKTFHEVESDILLYAFGRQIEVITDDNLVNEFKYGKGL